jgi:hypothetical protein
MQNPSPRDNSTSSVFTKLPPDLRRVVDIAIVERHPPTLQGVWMQFELAKHGVTYMSLYRYARRLRDRANVTELARLDADTDTDLTPAINRLAARQLLETFMNEDTFEPREIASLTASIRNLSRSEFQQRKLDEDSSIARERLEQHRTELQLKSEQLQLIRQRLQPLLESRKENSPHAHPNGRLSHEAPLPRDSEIPLTVSSPMHSKCET